MVLISYFQITRDGAYTKKCGKYGKLAVTAHIAAGHGLSGFAGI